MYRSQLQRPRKPSPFQAGTWAPFQQQLPWTAPQDLAAVMQRPRRRPRHSQALERPESRPSSVRRLRALVTG